ncbi:UNVERIFIED_CONTAM: LAS seventeen-binding protein 3 [Sesamum calycinum]|uniref:LAS seventeen-binding protein 3 n=1 Tax=Sesamum calycinum TaxID=2727403 RepID=A0AAW2MCD7_9LAMI
MEEEIKSLSVGAKLQYPKIELEDYDPKICSPRIILHIQVYDGFHKDVEDCNRGSSDNDKRNSMEHLLKADDKMELTGVDKEQKKDLAAENQKLNKYFCYDTPLSEETGVWIPVSVPPLPENEQLEWNRGFYVNGGYLPDGDLGWNECIGEEKEMTMWDVVLDMLLTARGKVSALASGDIHGCSISWISSHLLEQAWKEMAQTLTDANFGKMKEILESEPPKWLPDSAASACMLCNGRSLLPSKFRTGDPQRVCDVCCVRLEPVQTCLMSQVSRAAQSPTHDLTDLSTLRSWLNFPWGQSMEYEIYKATNTIQGYSKVGCLAPEKSIPSAVLKQAKGFAILTVAKVGLMVTYNVGTGLVVARREDGSWSPPSAIASVGIGWGAQDGKRSSFWYFSISLVDQMCSSTNWWREVTDFIIVLRTNSAIKTFSGNAHMSVGAGLSAAVGNVGRAAEADIRAGDGGYAACYTYSCSKGAFAGCSIQGNIVKTRAQENSRFYGNPSISAADILLGSMPRPPAASALYQALSELYKKH